MDVLVPLQDELQIVLQQEIKHFAAVSDHVRYHLVFLVAAVHYRIEEGQHRDVQ